jgi:hypothetical protein
MPDVALAAGVTVAFADLMAAMRDGTHSRVASNTEANRDRRRRFLGLQDSPDAVSGNPSFVPQSYSRARRNVACSFSFCFSQRTSSFFERSVLGFDSACLGLMLSLASSRAACAFRDSLFPPLAFRRPGGFFTPAFGFTAPLLALEIQCGLVASSRRIRPTQVQALLKKNGIDRARG